MRRRTLLAATLAMLGGCSPGSTQPGKSITIAAGVPGGVYDALASELANVIHRTYNSPTRTLRTSGALENLRLIHTGSADLGISQMDTASLALTGQTPFKRPLPVRALARLYDDYLQLVVDAQSKIRRLKDLQDATVVMGPRGSGTELLAARLLSATGVSVRRVTLGVSEAAKALESGDITAFFFAGGLPTPAIYALAKRHPVRLVPLDAHVELLQQRYGSLYSGRAVITSVYGLPEVCITVTVPNILMVHERMSNSDAESLTNLLLSARFQLANINQAALQINHWLAIQTTPIPLHPGAKQYYRSKKMNL